MIFSLFVCKFAHELDNIFYFVKWLTLLQMCILIAGELLFPLELDCKLCPRKEIFNFGKKCKELGIQYVGLCCGNAAHYTRSLCEGLGKTTAASKYNPDMSLHCVLGTNEKLCKWQTDETKQYFIGD